MLVKNSTNNMIISKNCKRANNFIDACFGLLLPSNPRALLFNTRFGIHTFGLKSPIDVLVLDKKNKVVKLKLSLKPNKIFFWNIKYSSVLELPENSIKENNVAINDILVFED